MERQQKVLGLLKQMIGIDSLTDTIQECDMEAWLLKQLASFGETVTSGRIPVQDNTGRGAVYGFICSRSQKSDTVIFMNHHDVVDRKAYGKLSPYALSPELLQEQLLKTETNPEIVADLKSGQWLFGRGSCDMKGGIAAQLAIFEEYAAVPGDINLLFLSVPDEESFSAGMRAAVPFLQEIKNKYGLTYRVLVNCEPNSREDDCLTAFTGSVGKVLPVTVVQGKAVHIGSYRKGINPLGILARLIAATEGNPILADSCGNEMSPPPAWMFFRDRKMQYDFSLPQRAAAYASFLSFTKTPADIMAILKKEAAVAITDSLQNVEKQFSMPVRTFGELLLQVREQPNFDAFYQALLMDSNTRIQQGDSNYPEQTIAIIEAVLDFSGLTEPMVILAYAPPYYPAADSLEFSDNRFRDLVASLSDTFPVHFEHYFNGVSDCSYCGIGTSFDAKAYEDNAPLWGNSYSFDIGLLQQMHIPFLLLGPWGKDLHDRGERVHIQSVTSVLPEKLRFVLKWAETNQ